jgi:uncharacterized protein YjiS (DUF1127 family)
MHTLHRPCPPGLAAPGFIVRLLERALAAWQRERMDRATFASLRALDDRTLRDLGFHRSELRSVAREVATGGAGDRIRSTAGEHLRA